MTSVATKNESYLSHFRAAERSLYLNGPRWVHDIRTNALSRFLELGFPTARRGNERWKYTNVGPIARAAFEYPTGTGPNGLTPADIKGAVLWHDSWANLVFVDGHYSEALSTAPGLTNGVRAGSLADAISAGDEAVESHLARFASVEEDGFTALNTAFVRDGAFVSIPDGESLETPLNLVFISTDRGGPTVSYPRVLVVAGAESKATVIESYVGLTDSPYFTNAVAEIVVGDGAEIKHHRLLAENENAYHVGVARVRQSDNSSFTSRAFAKGAALGRYDLNVLLNGENTYCELNGLYMTSGSQHMDNFINIEHTRPQGTSRLLYKGILDGKSRAIFGGTVLVRKEAQKTDSLQSDKNLLLSPDAEVDSKPALFIYADDVKCGHGATAGNIDQDTVFYMRSRGLDLEAASRLLLYGFASEIIDTVELDGLRSYLETLFLESLPKYKFEFEGAAA